MALSLIVAMTRQGVIGRNNQLPWNLPNDLKRFKRLTMGHPILMGRKTWDSLGRALPGRRNVVISRHPETLTLPEGVESARSLDEAIAQCSEPEIFVIGGAQIFREALPVAQKLYITWVEHPFEGDVVFEGFDSFEKNFKITAHQHEVEPFPYSFTDYVRV